MSEIQDPEKKPEKKNDRDFISEKIVRPAPSKKQIATKMATAACAGVIFGVVSAVCFALTWNSGRRETGQLRLPSPFRRTKWNPL